MTPDQDLSARLAELRTKTTDEDLHEDGRYFMECFTDLTKCGHGDTGNFDNRHDGTAIALLWNAYRSGQLITLADHTAAVQAAVAEAVEAERARTHAERMKLDSRIRNQRRELAFWGYCFTSQVWGVLRGKGIVSNDDRKRVTKLWLDREARRTAAIRSRGVAG